jgi:hypothetical protein
MPDLPEISIDTRGLPHGGIRLPSGTYLRAVASDGPYVAYKSGHRSALLVLASYDTEAHGRLLHISASWEKRVPSWPELVDIHGGFAPSMPMMMILPRPEKYVNAHEHTLNMYAIPKGWLDLLQAGAAPYVDECELDDGTIVSSDGHIVTLARRDHKLPWEFVTTFRDAYFDLQRDVMAWWVLRPPSLRGTLYMAFTPEDWQAGFFVGAPGITPAQASSINLLNSYRSGTAPIQRPREQRGTKRRKR